MATMKKKAILFGAMDTLEREGCNEAEMLRLFEILGQKRSVIMEVASIRKEVKCIKEALLSEKTAAA